MIGYPFYCEISENFLGLGFPELFFQTEPEMGCVYSWGEGGVISNLGDLGVGVLS